MAQPIFSSEVSFYPNECFICNKRTTLKRCSRCQMISYCGEAHQKSDWNSHKNFCKVVSRLLIENKVSHIFEKFRGCTLKEWITAREDTCNLIDHLLAHNIHEYEKEMLYYPRCCFVCYDTRQSNLTSCSRCPLVSFCQEHPRSPLHDKMCSEYKRCHYLINEYDKTKGLFPSTVAKIVTSTPMGFPKSITSVADYFNQNPTFCLNSNENLQVYISPSFSFPLTLFSAIQKLNLTILPKMTFNVSGFPQNMFMFRCWEILLHFFPNLTCLTVVLCRNNLTLDPVLMPLCPQCTASGKKLFIQLVALSLQDHFEIDPCNHSDLAAVFNVVDVEVLSPSFKLFMKLSAKLSCPLILTTATETEHNSLFQHYNTPFWKPLICYQGKNEFSSMWSLRDSKTWEISRPSQFVFIAKAPRQSNVKGKIDKETREVPRELKGKNEKTDKKMLTKKFFYPGICHVCKTCESTVPCKRCKMIFYCGESHMKKDSPEHREICKVILKLLTEKGTPHLYDNLKTDSEESWLSTKLGFIKEAKLKLKREMEDFEKQMFLFPKICFVCRESDLSVLKTCKCGVSLCKIHRDNAVHKNLCKSFNLDMKMSVSENIPTLPTIAAVPLSENRKNLPPCLKSFMESYINSKIEDSNPSTQNMIKVLVSDFLTRPLTFIYALEKLNISVPKTMVIHVIGAIDKEIEDAGYWRIVTYWLSNLKSLKVVFIGIELSDKQKPSFRHPLIFINSNAENGKAFDFEIFPGRYDQFFKSNSFSKPNMIIGYNLELDKSHLGVAEFTWRETLSVIKTINVPFILTARSEERARKDNEMVCSVLGKVVKCQFFLKNPYSSLLPERDFKTERLCYSNNYLIAYKSFTNTKTAKKEILKVANGIFKATNNCEKSSENECSKPKEINKELEVQATSETVDSMEKDHLKDDEILKKNLLLEQENKILKENLCLQEENERLRKEMLKLNQDIAGVDIEN